MNFKTILTESDKYRVVQSIQMMSKTDIVDVLIDAVFKDKSL